MKRKRANLATALFRGLVEHSVVGMLVLEDFGENLTVLFANIAALETLELKDIDHFTIESLFPDPERLGNFHGLNRSMLRHEGLTSEVLMRKANQHHFLASLSVKAIQQDGLNLILLSFLDVTVEKKLTRDLEAKQAEIERAYSESLAQNLQLKALDEAKDKFIALTTHELRTPLSAIIATADVLELHLYESEEQKEEFIHTIGEQGRHLLELVNDILDFAKIRAGKMDFYVEHVNLRDLVGKLASGFSHMAVQENIRIVVESDFYNPQVWGDVLRLKEIFNNVISNAIKYNRTNGSVTISLSEVTNDSGRKLARVTVRDTGIGISEENISCVFNEFETAGHAYRHHKGTGLGMPISKRLIESMGGALTLASVAGVGTEFYVDVPLEKVLSDEHYRTRPDADTDFAA